MSVIQKKYNSGAVYCKVCKSSHCVRGQNDKTTCKSVRIAASCQYVKKTTKVDARKKPGFEILMTDSDSEDETILAAATPIQDNSETEKNAHKIVFTKKMSWFDICELDADKD